MHEIVAKYLFLLLDEPSPSQPKSDPVTPSERQIAAALAVLLRETEQSRYTLDPPLESEGYSPITEPPPSL